MPNIEVLQKLPFTVDRNMPRSLVDQVVAGVKQAIDFGKYAAGDVIPGTRDLAEMLGVSRIVTRQAVRRLADDGYLSPRPGVGCVVLSRYAKQWKGSVLLVLPSEKGYYYTNAFADELTLILAREGWRVLRVLTKKRDCSLLELEIAHGADFALVMFENEPALRRLRQASIPFATVGCSAAGSVFHVCYRRQAALESAIGEIVNSGARRVWQVGFEPQRPEFDVLERTGLDCREIVIRPTHKDEEMSPTVAALEWFADKLCHGRAALPDFIYFTDDWVCQGALLAFLRFGIRIPEDVRVLTWANLGSGPYACYPLDRAEISPFDNADKVANNLVSCLKGSKFSTVVELQTVLRRA